MQVLRLELSDFVLWLLIVVAIYKFILKKFWKRKSPSTLHKEWLPIPAPISNSPIPLKSHIETVYYQKDGFHVLTDSIQNTTPFENQFDHVEKLFLMIPGNPGPCEVYQYFLLQLLQETCNREGNESAQSIHTCAVSLLGHDLFNTKHAQNTKRNVSLHEQIEHKAWILLEWIPKRYKNVKKIILMGHSIGSYMIIQVLKRYEKQLQKNYSLEINPSSPLPSLQFVCCFPTFERMLQSPNGQSKKFAVMYGRLPITFLLHLLSFILPTVSLKRLLIQCLSFWNESVKSNATNPVIGQLLFRFIHPSSVSNLLFLAKQEFLTLKELDPLVSTLQQYNNIIFYIFSTQDAWTPMEYVWNLKEKVFGKNQEEAWNKQTQIDSESRHAFCMYQDDMKRVCNTIINKFKL